MLKLRITFFTLIVITIILGLLSRHFAAIPLFIGDILWATMIYFIVRFIFITKPVKFIVMVSLGFCYAIEFSQLYKAPWIDHLRQTLFGKLVLGDTFLWTDLLCYTVGVVIAISIDKTILSNHD